jgi:hypothetical protein
VITAALSPKPEPWINGLDGTFLASRDALSRRPPAGPALSLCATSTRPGPGARLLLPHAKRPRCRRCRFRRRPVTRVGRSGRCEARRTQAVAPSVTHRVRGRLATRGRSGLDEGRCLFGFPHPRGQRQPDSAIPCQRVGPQVWGSPVGFGSLGKSEAGLGDRRP